MTMFPPGADPRVFAMLIPIVGIVFSMTAAIVLGLPLVRVLARRLDPASERAAPPREVADTRERLERIESAVEGIALEVERLAEGQRFTARLLAERAPGGALPAANLPRG